MSPTRAKLIEMSKHVKALQEICSDELEGCACETTNQMVMHVFYPEGEFKTYRAWLEEGQQVKKGSKAFPVWGRKRKVAVKDGGEESQYKFFPTANLFHESQVEAVEVEA